MSGTTCLKLAILFVLSKMELVIVKQVTKKGCEIHIGQSQPRGAGQVWVALGAELGDISWTLIMTSPQVLWLCTGAEPT